MGRGTTHHYYSGVFARALPSLPTWDSDEEYRNYQWATWARQRLPNTQQWSGRLANNFKFGCKATWWRRRRFAFVSPCPPPPGGKKCAGARIALSLTNPRRHYHLSSLSLSLPPLARPRLRISCPAGKEVAGEFASSHPSPRASLRYSRSIHPHPMFLLRKDFGLCFSHSPP